MYDILWCHIRQNFIYRIDGLCFVLSVDSEFPLSFIERNKEGVVYFVRFKERLEKAKRWSVLIS